MNMVSKGDKSLVMLGREKLRRRSNLNGVEFKVTALKHQIKTKDLKYGNTSESRISGILGDFLMVLSKTLNFKFSLHKPADGKWGGREKSRKLGWNGMIGDIGEGLAEFGIGSFTISAARSEVVQFSIGNIEYVKTFFLSTNTAKTFNYFLFVNPLSIDSYIAVILIMIISALSLFFIIFMVDDERSAEFTLRKCFTFTISGVSFIRRWTVTPSSISGRVVFITVLMTGLLCQVH